MDLHTLIEGTAIERTSGDPEGVRVCDITEDSRTAVPGSLFVARTGTRDRGSSYAREAVGSGAVAVLTDDGSLPGSLGAGVCVLYARDAARIGCVLAERFYGDPSAQLALAAVTGTNGKTSVATLVDRILDKSGVRCGLVGSVEVDDGRERSRAALTTPPGIELSRSLATMREHGCVACALEASSHAIDQGRVSALEIDAAGFTNLSGDHLDYHGDLASYTDAKAGLFRLLDRGAVAVVNADDPASRTMLGACAAGVRRVRVSTLGDDADWAGCFVRETIDASTLRARTPVGDLELTTPLFGAHNASNLLVACALADAILRRVGMDDARVRDALIGAAPTLAPPRGRHERVDREGDDLRVLVDFAHTDAALGASLAALRRVSPEGSSIWCVFGCGGDRDASKRPRMGAAACAGADRVVITSDNPRTERPGAIIDDILRGVTDRSRVEVHADRARAIASSIGHAAPGDTVLIAGKGHESEQILAGECGSLVRVAFDDAAHARAALAARRVAAANAGGVVL